MLRRLLDRLEGRWLDELAAVDACGAACADQGQPAPSTTSWLRARLHMGTSTASGWVRTAQALFRGPLTGTAKALTDGQLSAAHAAVLATAPTTYPSNTAAEAEPVLLAAATAWTHPGCGGSSPTCGWSPTRAPPTPRPSANISSVAYGWPPPWTA